MVHQDPSCFGCFREDWNSFVWIGMIRFGLRQHPSETSVKVSSKTDLFCCFSEDLVMVWFGMVRFGLRQHPSEAFVKFSSKSDLFWLF